MDYNRATLKDMLMDTNRKIMDRKIHLSRTIFDLPWGTDPADSRLVASMKSNIADLTTCRDNLIKDLDRLST